MIFLKLNRELKESDVGRKVRLINGCDTEIKGIHNGCYMVRYGDGYKAIKPNGKSIIEGMYDIVMLEAKSYIIC